MFVVCDLLNRLFKPLPSDQEAVENMVNKRVDKAPDQIEDEDFSDRLSMSDRNKLINKLMQSKFLMDSKYKAHKECWVSVASQLVRTNIKQINKVSELAKSANDGQEPGVWDQICNQFSDDSQLEEQKAKDKDQHIDSEANTEAFTQICRGLLEKVKKQQQSHLPISCTETMKGAQRNLWIHHNILAQEIDEYIKN